MFSQSLCSTTFVKLTVIWNSNVKDIETKQKEASILAFFYIEVKRTLLIEKC